MKQQEIERVIKIEDAYNASNYYLSIGTIGKRWSQNGDLCISVHTLMLSDSIILFDVPLLTIY